MQATIDAGTEKPVTGPILSHAHWRTGEPTATIHGWAMREMAPWLLDGVNHAEAKALFDHLNATHNWAILYKFAHGQVSIAAKPDTARNQRLFTARALPYLHFFCEIAKTLPDNFQTTLCLNLKDEVPDRDFPAPVFCFHKKRGLRNPLLPDIDFLYNNFYGDPKFLDNLPYEEKLPCAVFAGSTTGGVITPTVARALSMPRLRAAGYFQGNERVDFRLTTIVQCTPEARALLETMPFCRKPRLDWTEQLQRRFILSMDGNGATWSRVVLALLSNSVLLKYDSDFIVYYYGGMQPWVHYVPIANDSDVEKIIDLEARDPAPFEQIAAAGRRFAMTYLNRDSVYEYTKMLLLLYAECIADTPHGRPDPVYVRDDDGYALALPCVLSARKMYVKKVYDAGPEDSTIRFDRNAHGDVAEPVLFFGPYLHLEPGDYSFRLNGALEGSLGLRFNKWSGAECLKDVVVTSFDAPVRVTVEAAAEKVEVVGIRLDDTLAMTLSSIELDRVPLAPAEKPRAP
jgi:hypothetical protein